MTLTILPLAILCAYRLTQVVLYDTILERPICWLCRHNGYLEGLLTCPHCTGFWASVVTALLVYFSRLWAPLIVVVWAFGIAGAVSIIEHATHWLEPELLPPPLEVEPDGQFIEQE